MIVLKMPFLKIRLLCTRRSENMADLLDKLDKEVQQQITKLKVNDASLDKIIYCFEKSFKKYDHFCQHYYEYCIKSIKKQKIDYSKDDITKFSIYLSKYQDKKSFQTITGIFLSALINLSDENEFVVITEHFQKSIDLFAWKNTKKITVLGSVGEHVGRNMHEGELLIKGNVERCIGSGIESGKIIVEGDAGHLVGYLSKSSATIELNGNYESIFYDCKGQVFHKGVLIFNDGKPINLNFDFIHDELFSYYAPNK